MHRARDGPALPERGPEPIARLVPCEPARSALAEDTGPVSNPHRGISSPEDSDRKRHTLLRPIPHAIPNRPGSRGGLPRRRARGLGGTRVLRPGETSACRGPSDRGGARWESPGSYEALAALPGTGPVTAAAVASIS